MLRVSDVRGQVDFAILTVREDEFEAVLDRFQPREPLYGGKHLYEYARVQTTFGATRQVAMVRLPEQGQNTAQAVASETIADLDPAWIILAGIAGAVPDLDFTLGDVIIASRFHDFAVSAASEGRELMYEQMGGPVHAEVAKLVGGLPAVASSSRRLG